MLALRMVLSIRPGLSAEALQNHFRHRPPIISTMERPSTGRRGWQELYKPGFAPRNKTLSFTVSEAEAAAIDEAAKAAGITRSAYLTKKQVAALAKAATRAQAEGQKSPREEAIASRRLIPIGSLDRGSYRPPEADL